MQGKLPDHTPIRALLGYRAKSFLSRILASSRSVSYTLNRAIRLLTRKVEQ